MPSGSVEHDDDDDERQDDETARPATVILRDIASAPPFLDLKYGHCAGCRRAGSRCDGHDNYTQACIQCRRRQDDCEWQIVRNTVKDKGKGKKRAKSRKREESAVSARSENDDNDDDEQDEDEDAPPRKRGKSRSRSAVPWIQLEDQHGKLPVPSAGWPSAATFSHTFGRPAVKEEQVKMEPVSNDEGDGSSSDSSDDEEDGDEERQATDALQEDEEDVKKRHTSFKVKDCDPEQMLAELQSSTKGNHFLTTQSYTSLLTSMHLEKASDLSTSLYWWDFSPSARAVRAKYPSLLEIKHEDWRNMSYLHRLLAENVYNWSLWPRPPQPSSSDRPSTSTLPSEITAIILSQISSSNIHKQVLSSLNDTQLKLLRTNHRNDRIPFNLRESYKKKKSVFEKSTYAIPTISNEELLEEYFNREDLILDHVEAIQEPIGVLVQNAIERVLLKVAEMRLPKGARRPLSAEKNVKKIDIKGKGRAAEGQEEQEGEEAESSKPTRRNKKAQAPGDWKSMLLATISVPGLPRE